MSEGKYWRLPLFATEKTLADSSTRPVKLFTVPDGMLLFEKALVSARNKAAFNGDNVCRDGIVSGI
jgi:hypothetical protein